MTVNEKELEILNQIYEDKKISQRKIAANLNISLGLVNLFIKKLSSKGLIKIRKLKNKQILKYILTKRGFEERIRFNYEALKLNIKYFAQMKETLLTQLQDIEGENSELYIYDTDIWAELIFLGVKSYHFNFKGFITDNPEEEKKLGYQVFNIDNDLKNKKNIIILANDKYKKSHILDRTIFRGRIIWL